MKTGSKIGLLGTVLLNVSAGGGPNCSVSRSFAKKGSWPENKFGKILESIFFPLAFFNRINLWKAAHPQKPHSQGIQDLADIWAGWLAVWLEGVMLL